MCLDEVELDVWFLLIVGTKFHLSCCSRCNGLNQVVLQHVGRNGKSS